MATSPDLQTAAPSSIGGIVDVAATVDAMRFGRYLLGIVAACVAILIVDGCDVMVVGFLAPPYLQVSASPTPR